MIALAVDDVVDLRRWIISGAVVVLAHGAIAAGMIRWREPIEFAEPGGAAIVIDFAPVAVAPATQQSTIAGGSEQVSEIVPEQKVQQQPVEEPPPDIKPAPNPELALVPPREVQQEVVEEPAPMAPQSGQTGAAPKAPIEAQPNPSNSNAIPMYRTRIAVLLERHKRYPTAAQSRRQEGIAQVFFSIDREGRVLDSRIVRSAGAAALDAEALALLKRAQPFPPPPPELAGERVTLTVPIAFHLK
jgi:periplasmic protein TonB